MKYTDTLKNCLKNEPKISNRQSFKKAIKISVFKTLIR